MFIDPENWISDLSQEMVARLQRSAVIAYQIVANAILLHSRQAAFHRLLLASAVQLLSLNDR
jgi:hypothetical protein